MNKWLPMVTQDRLGGPPLRGARAEPTRIYLLQAARRANWGNYEAHGLFDMACMLALGWVGTAKAQTAAVEEVVITARSTEDQLPQQLAQYGTHVDVVTAAQIQNGGYVDVASALEAMAPALYISSQNGPFDYVQVSLQGSRTEDVLWLVDGIRINNRLYGGTTPLDTIPASMIENIEVLDGGQSLFYGTQAVAGAVNIVTESFTDRPDGGWSAGIDSNGEKHIDGYYRDALSGNKFVIFASHDESPGFQPYPTADYQPSGTDRHRGYNVTTLGTKYANDFTDDLALSASYLHTDATLGYAQPMLTAVNYNQRDEDLVSSKLDYTPSDTFKFFIKDYYLYCQVSANQIVRQGADLAGYHQPALIENSQIAGDSAGKW